MNSLTCHYTAAIYVLFAQASFGQQLLPNNAVNRIGLNQFQPPSTI
jgi:hypothetical protein